MQMGTLDTSIRYPAVQLSMTAETMTRGEQLLSSLRTTDRGPGSSSNGTKTGFSLRGSILTAQVDTTFNASGCGAGTVHLQQRQSGNDGRKYL